MPFIPRTSPSSDAVVTVENATAYIGEGRMFSVASPIITVAGAGETDFICRVPADVHIHFSVEVAATKLSHFELYEGPTITVEGAAMAPLNTNRRLAALASVCTTFYGSIITVDGLYLEGFIVGDSVGGGKGGGAERSKKWVSAEDEDYLLRITTTAAATDIVLRARFWEHT